MGAGSCTSSVVLPNFCVIFLSFKSQVLYSGPEHSSFDELAVALAVALAANPIIKPLEAPL